MSADREADMTDNNAYRIRHDNDSVHDRSLLSAGFRVGNTIYISGQVAVDDNRQLVGVGDFPAQVRQVMANIKRILEAGGSGLDKIVHTTTYVTDIENARQHWIALKREYFTFPYPAGTFVEISRLASKEALIEVDVVAIVDGETIA
jgi:2-iminobutanoate/2-iminopropanoate deaminase